MSVPSTRPAFQHAAECGILSAGFKEGFMEGNRAGSISLRARVALARYAFRPSKGLSQNFLFDEASLNEIADVAEIRGGDRVLEIGPGAGTLTAVMAERGARVLALEIDRALMPVLEEVLAPYPNAQIKNEDASRARFGDAIEAAFGEGEYKIVSNLPYSLTSELIERAVLQARKPSRVVVTVQEEAARRIVASPGEKAYCALAVKVRLYGEASALLRLPPESFEPKPHVWSRVARIVRHAAPLAPPEAEPSIVRLIDACFAMRRKTIANNLRAAYPSAGEAAIIALHEAGIDPMARGETLTIERVIGLRAAMDRREIP